MRSAAIILSLCLLSAAPPSESAPAPAAAAAIHEATVDVSIQGPTTASGGFALVGSGPKGAVLRWRIESPDGAAEPLRLLDASGAPVLVFMSPSPGRYRVVLTGQVASDGLDPFGESTHVVTVGGVPPVPPGPTPPGPVPPEPQPTTGPIFGVVLVDSEGDDSLTAEQRTSLNSADVHEYLQAKGLKVGGAVQWRVWDDDKISDADLSEESEVLRKAYAEAKAKFGGRAYIVLSNGKTGFSGPLPETHAAILTLLKTYGG